MPRGQAVDLDTELKIIEYLVKSSMTLAAIAEECGVDTRTVSRLKKKHKDNIDARKRTLAYTKVIDRSLMDSVKNKSHRLIKLDKLLQDELDRIENDSYDEDGNYIGIPSGDYALLLKMHDNDQKDIINLLKTSDQMNKTNIDRFNKDRQILIKLKEIQEETDMKDEALHAMMEFVTSLDRD